jgi:hypothetical protein
MAPGASLKVIGIQELPGVNGAKADLDLTNAAFLQTDMLSGKLARRESESTIAPQISSITPTASGCLSHWTRIHTSSAW